MSSTKIVTCIVFVWLLSQHVCIAQSFKFTENDEGIALSEGKHPIYFYQQKTKSLNGQYPRANYLHPVYGLKGEILTEDFPADHLHQRGIFWAWHQLIVDGERIGDGWECKGVDWQVTNSDTDTDGNKASLNVTVDWVGELKEKETTFIREHTTITAYAATGGYRTIYFDIHLTAQAKDVMLGGSEDIKGYSGFSARVILPDDIQFYSKKGVLTPINPAMKAGGWVDMVGTFGKKRSGFTMMADTTLSQPFHGWILRDKKSMQNAAFPGREPIRIPAGETLHLRYALVIHEYKLPRETLLNIYDKFTTNL